MVRNPKEVRPLTSKEIAKIVSSVLGSCLAWCDVEEVVGALDHLVEFHDEYVFELRVMKKMFAEGAEPLVTQIKEAKRQKGQ